jgi:hypothetical protein
VPSLGLGLGLQCSKTSAPIYKDLVNLVRNGKFEGSANWSANDVEYFTTSNNTGFFKATKSNGGIRSTLTLERDSTYFMRAKIKANSNKVTLQIDGTNKASHSGNGEFEYVYRKFVWSQETKIWGVRIRDERDAEHDEIQVTEVMLVKLEGKLANMTAEKLNNILPYIKP